MIRMLNGMLLGIVGLGLGACAAIPLTPGAEHVRFAQGEPQGCAYLGDVDGIDGGLKQGSAMEVGARNDVRNKAFAMGGNVVVLTGHQASYATSVYGQSHGYGSGYGAGYASGYHYGNAGAYEGAYDYGSNYQQYGSVHGGTYKSDVVMTGSVYRCGSKGSAPRSSQR